MKTCTQCNETKELSAFPMYSTGPRKGTTNGGKCKVCYARRMAIARGSKEYKPTPKTTDEVRDRIVKLYKANMFPQDIAKEVGVCKATVKDILKRIGISIKSQREWALIKWGTEEERKARRRLAEKAKLLRKKVQLLLPFFKSGCLDCNEKDPICLEFDHRNPQDKCFDVAGSVGQVSTERLLAEIAKCDVVCSNCHKKRTAKMFGSWRVGV